MKSLGFTFDDQPGGLLKGCHYGRHVHWKASPQINEIRYPYWVLDYSRNGGLVDCSTAFADPGIRMGHTAHLYPPGQTYYERIIHAGYDTSAWVLFTGEYPFLRQMLDNPAHFLRILDTDDLLHDLMLKIAENSVYGNSSYWKCQATFCGIIDCLSRMTPGRDGYTFTLSDSGAAAESLADRAVNYLETHYQKKVTMPMIASALGVSVSSLAHHFQTEKGETVMETLLRIRIQQSLPLLTAGIPLKTIAESIGFCNEFYYSRQFKRLMNVSPGIWRSHDDPYPD